MFANSLRLFCLVIIMIQAFACSVGIPAIEPLENKVMRLVDITPGEGETAGPDARVTLTFSQRVDPLTVGAKTIIVARAESLPEDISDIEEKGVGGLDLPKGIYLVSEDHLKVEYEPENGFDSTGEYKIVVTHGLCSEDGVTFNGNGSYDKPFVSNFFVNGSGESSLDVGGDVDADVNPEDKLQQGTGDPELPGPAYLQINEIYYDVDGTDTNGDVFIELYGEPGGGLRGYYIALVNGDDGKTYKTIPISEGHVVGDDGLFVIADTDTGGKSNVEGADLLDNFDPQNGPDSIQLIDPDGSLVDVVGYGNLKVEKAQNGLVMYETAPSINAPSGMSLSRSGDMGDSGDNSFDFVINTTPSPDSLKVQQK